MKVERDSDVEEFCAPFFAGSYYNYNAGWEGKEQKSTDVWVRKGTGGKMIRACRPGKLCSCPGGPQA